MSRLWVTKDLKNKVIPLPERKCLAGFRHPYYGAASYFEQGVSDILLTNSYLLATIPIFQEPHECIVQHRRKVLPPRA